MSSLIKLCAGEKHRLPTCTGVMGTEWSPGSPAPWLPYFPARHCLAAVPVPGFGLHCGIWNPSSSSQLHWKVLTNNELFCVNGPSPSSACAVFLVANISSRLTHEILLPWHSCSWLSFSAGGLHVVEAGHLTISRPPQALLVTEILFLWVPRLIHYPSQIPGHLLSVQITDWPGEEEQSHVQTDTHLIQDRELVHLGKYLKKKKEQDLETWQHSILEVCQSFLCSNTQTIQNIDPAIIDRDF